MAKAKKQAILHKKYVWPDVAKVAKAKTSSRGRQPRQALGEQQIVAAREEELRFSSDGNQGLKAQWAKPAKAIGKTAKVGPRTIQNWRDKKKAPLYFKEVVRLLFEKPKANSEKAPRILGSALTEEEVRILFQTMVPPVMLGGQPYWDWKPYWDQMQVLGVVLYRENLF
jgi:hypothetical protein